MQPSECAHGPERVRFQLGEKIVVKVEPAKRRVPGKRVGSSERLDRIVRHVAPRQLTKVLERKVGDSFNDG